MSKTELIQNTGIQEFEISVPFRVDIAKGASVTIVTEQEYTIPDNHVGIISIRRSLGRKGILLGAGLCKPGYKGTLELQLANFGINTLELRAGDGVANLIICQCGRDIND